MASGDKLHLIERAAERLIQTGAAPTGLATEPASGTVPRAGGMNDGAPPGSADPGSEQGHEIAASGPHAAQAEAGPAPGPILPDPAPRHATVAPSGAVIPLESLVAAGLVEGSLGRTRVAEEFRLVQNQILRTAFGAGADPGFSNLLMVTSSRPNEGKSFTAINLAASIARRGDNRVLLVDADAKHGSLSDQMDLKHCAGVLELASTPDLSPAACILETAVEGLAILPVGHARGHRAELFASNPMRRLMQTLGRTFADRLVVLDVAPCLSTSDPAALSAAVGQVLFVVEAERTQRDEVEAALDLIQTCPTIMLMLNKIQMTTSHSFGAYSYSYSS